MNILVAMSGGVDSSVSLLLSKSTLSHSDKLCGVTLELHDRNSPLSVYDDENTADARAICESQGAPHVSLYSYPMFEASVMDYFARSYLMGLTPNPCVVCNRDIKLALLSDYASDNGYELIATGHYARKTKIGDYYYIKRAVDLTKDQSYVLARITREQLERTIFPLGDYTKADIRRIAEENDFINARRRDSQDICFIPDGDYMAFLEGYAEKHGLCLPDEGDYVMNGEVVGRHRGHVSYTTGQRKGLGISMGRHVFVTGKDAETNTVTLGDENELYKTRVAIGDLHLPSDPHALDGRLRVSVKLRYAHKPAAALFSRVGDGEAILEFDEAVRAPTPGQFAVIYTEETACTDDSEYSGLVLGSGVILHK